MVATLTLLELSNTTTNPTTATNLNMGSSVSSNLSSSLYPITVGTYGISKVLQLSFGGTFTSITAIKMYQSAGTNVTGEILNYGTSTVYHVPTGGSYADSVAITSVPTSLPSTANILINGTITYTVTTTQNTTDYLFLQSSLSTIVSATSIPTKTLSFTWSETP